MIKNITPIVIIIIFSVLISLPLLKPGIFSMHDDQQIARLFVFDKALKDGQFPIRWVSGLGFGYGYPLFVFYPPLIYMFGEIFHLFGFGYIDSIKLVFFSGILFSGLSIYLLVKELWGKFSATISALFYIIVPYRALDLYVRGALAESFAFVWLPAILWSFYKLSKTQNSKYIYFSGLFLALLMITHNLIFLPFATILIILIIFLGSAAENKILFIKQVFLGGAVGAGISAFFWMPALFEKNYTIVDSLLLVNLADYKIHFVYPQQLWNWPWGFGGSTAGLADGISFKIGKLHIILALLSLIIAVARKNLAKRKLRLQSRGDNLIIIFFILFAFSAFMTTFYSVFVWKMIPALAYLQFPWRFLTFTALFSSVLAGALIHYLKLPVVKIVSATILVILLLLPNLKLFRPQFYRTGLTDTIATTRDAISWDVSLSSFEYLPKGVALYKSELGTNLVKIDKSQIPIRPIDTISGNPQITIQKNTTTTTQFEINSQTATVVKANIFNFPGWLLEIDGRQAAINDENPLRLITFSVPKGIHSVKIVFGNTPTRLAANYLSLLSILCFVVLVFKKWMTLNTH